MRKCGKCGEVKPLDEFYKRKDTGKPTGGCKVCVRSDSAKWREENPERFSEQIRSWRLRTTFGITVDDYDALLLKQGGSCALCGALPPSGRSRHLDVDHCHKTGAVRGLLCSPCNRGIGALNDDSALLLCAASYIERARRREAM